VLTGPASARNLLFFGLQAIIVLGIILLALNSSDNKRTLPKAFGDEVLVTDNSIG
jgi:hypothetical protein